MHAKTVLLHEDRFVINFHGIYCIQMLYFTHRQRFCLLTICWAMMALLRNWVLRLGLIHKVHFKVRKSKFFTKYFLMCIPKYDHWENMSTNWIRPPRPSEAKNCPNRVFCPTLLYVLQGPNLRPFEAANLNPTFRLRGHSRPRPQLRPLGAAVMDPTSKGARCGVGGGKRSKRWWKVFRENHKTMYAK